MQNPAMKIVDRESGAHWGKPIPPIVNQAFDLLCVVRFALRRFWHCSMFRLVGGELYRLPLRILAALRDQGLRTGPAIPNDPRQHGQMSLREESVFLFACSNDIKGLSREHPWMGPLDQQLAARAYQLGAIALGGMVDASRQKHDKA